jgi:hypothetical protein
MEAVSTRNRKHRTFEVNKMNWKPGSRGCSQRGLETIEAAKQILLSP